VLSRNKKIAIALVAVFAIAAVAATVAWHRPVAGSRAQAHDE